MTVTIYTWQHQFEQTRDLYGHYMDCKTQLKN